MKNKKTIILLLLIAIVGVVGLTLAYFANTANVQNEFKTKQYGTTVEEVFESPSDWTPGTTTDKTLTVTNSGQVDEAVRVSYTETWTSKNSNVEGDLELSQGNNRATIINFSDNGDWTPVTESDNKTYYYYNYKLTPGETTSTLLDSVTFNKDIVNTNNCVETKTATGKKVECTSDGAGYDGATYKLVFKVETVQYDKYSEAWGTSAAISNDSKPLVLKGLKVNNINKTYEDGDRTAMFAFSHPQTEQMKATTDYRYIGNIPNNYVKFNCDNDGTNCEIWRIIGVFEVDDGTGTYEQRIKLVRGSAFSTEMAWDSNGENDWTNASLKEYLNNDYYNDLTNNTRIMIDNSKFYLGGGSESDRSEFGTAEEIYVWERSNALCSLCGNDISKKEWIGKISLMYPSDVYMVYGKGVDDVCYNDPTNCYDETTTKGWIYNSNILEGQLSRSTTWLLSPYSKGYSEAFDVFIDGTLYFYYRGDITLLSFGIRPVVYLKPSINIVSGEGTEQNPYILG